MKALISILIIIVGILGIYYSYNEFKSIQDIEQTIEYKTNNTIDNLALNYLGIERENILEKEIQRRSKSAKTILVGSFIFVVAGILSLVLINRKIGSI